MREYPKEVYNLLYALYDKKEYDGLMNFDDEEITKISHQISDVEKEINLVMDKRVHPYTREKLDKLIEKQKDLLYTYFYKENKLIYEGGVTDGIDLIISNFKLEKKNNKITD